MNLQVQRDDAIDAYFDLSAYPSGKEIFVFMVLAELARRDCGALSIRLIFVPSENELSITGLQAADVETHRRAYLISQSLIMMPSISSYTICNSRRDAAELLARSRRHVFPPGYATANSKLRQGSHQGTDILRECIKERATRNEMPRLDIPRQASEYVKGWLKSRLGNRRLLTITLGSPSCGYGGGAVGCHGLDFLEKFDTTTYLAVFVADKWLETDILPECYRCIPIFPGAGTFSPLRYALYSKACVNLIEAPASAWFCHADPSIRRIFFGDGVCRHSSNGGREGISIVGYDGSTIFESLKEVEVAFEKNLPDGREDVPSTIQVMSINDFFQQALKLQGSGETLGQAIKIYTAILKVNPGHAGALGMLGVTAMILGDAPQALLLIERAAMLDGEEPAHHYNLGSVLTLLGREGEAAASYRRALSINPDLKEAWGKLAAIEASCGRPYEAEACYRDATTETRASVQVLFEFADCLANMGRHEKAADVYLAAGRRYIDRLDDEDFANAMSGIFRRRPYAARNASFISHWPVETNQDSESWNLSLEETEE